MSARSVSIWITSAITEPEQAIFHFETTRKSGFACIALLSTGFFVRKHLNELKVLKFHGGHVPPSTRFVNYLKTDSFFGAVDLNRRPMANAFPSVAT